MEGQSRGYIDSVETRATGQANTEGEGFSNEVLHSMPGSSQYVSSDPARVSGEVGTSRNEKQSFTVSDLRSSIDGISAPVSVSFKSDKSSVVYAYVNKPVDKTNPLSSGTNKDYLNSQSVNASNRPRCVQPPVFDGNRKKWPEFRSVWMRYAANEFVDDIDRAHALKELLRGEALEYVGAIYATQANAYDRILDRLDTIYSDVSMCVQSVLEDLQQLKSDSDMKALVKFVNLVETAYSQLGEVGHINAICMTHIDSLADLLPMSIKRQWMRQFSMMSHAEKLHPFPHFMVFLENERSIALRLVERDKRSQFKAESQSSSSSKSKAINFHVNAGKPHDDSQSNAFCVIHSANHLLEQCRTFLAMSITERYEVLKQHNLCFQCFSKHARKFCKFKRNCNVCNKIGHHVLLCKMEKHAKESLEQRDSTEVAASTGSHVSSHHSSLESNVGSALFPIQQARVANSLHKALIFFDSGSNASFISEKAAKTWGAKRLKKVNLKVSTLGHNGIVESTYLYEVGLLNKNNELVTINVYGLSKLTDVVNSLDISVLKQLFPNIPPNLLVKESRKIDLLIGNDYHGLYPIHQIAKSGDHLSVMEGPFGLCVQGSHPALVNGASATRSVSAHAEVQCCQVILHNNGQLAKLDSVSCYATKSEKSAIDNFILGPTPDQSYTVELHYFYRPASLTAGVDSGTTWLSTNASVALLYGSLIEAYTFMKGEPDLVQNYTQRFTEALSRVKNFGEAQEVTDAYRTGLIIRDKT